MLVGRKMNLLDAFDFCSFSYTSRWKMTIMKARQPVCLLSRSKRLFQGRCPLCSCQGRLWSLCSGSSVAVAWHVLFLPIPLVTFSTCVVLLCHLALKLGYITEFCSHFLFIYGSFCKGLKFYCNGKHFLHFLGWVFLPWHRWTIRKFCTDNAIWWSSSLVQHWFVNLRFKKFKINSLFAFKVETVPRCWELLFRWIRTWWIEGSR